MTARTFVVAVAWLAAMAGAAALVFAATAGVGLAGSSGANFSVIFGGLALAVAIDASVGAVLTLRRPGNIVGVVLMLAAILLAAAILGFPGGAVLYEERGRHDLLAGVVALIGALGIYPSVIVAGPLLALVFPDGRLPGPRWKWPVGAIVAMIAFGSATVVVRPGPIGGSGSSFADNPFGVSGLSGSEPLWAIGDTLAAAALPFAALLALAAVTVRVRRSRGVERAQLKWFVASNAVVGVFLTVSVVDGATQTIVNLLSPLSLSLPPIAVGIAILRYRLYDIDRLISRTVSWAVISGVLVSVFAGAVFGGQTALAGVVGDDSSLVVAASTLVAFALFQPVRRRVQSAVDRRFDRARYDAQRTVEDLAAGLRNEFDLERLGTGLGAVVGQALAPSSVGVWLRSSLRSR